MWTHASDAALMDVLEGTASDRVLSHVSACGKCRARVDQARPALDLVTRATAPEPAPVYWDAMRRQVARGLAGESRPRFRRPIWAAALAGAAMAAAIAVWPGSAPAPTVPASPAAALPAWSPLPPSDEDPGLSVLEDLAPTALAGAPSVGCTDVTECIASLDDEEVGALAELLREEMDDGRAL